MSVNLVLCSFICLPSSVGYGHYTNDLLFVLAATIIYKYDSPLEVCLGSPNTSFDSAN